MQERAAARIRNASKREYTIAQAYYDRTVWKFFHGYPLAGAQFAMALCAWERVETAQRNWFDVLDLPTRQQAVATKVNLAAIRPRQYPNSVTAELLATVASTRLGIRKPKSIAAAVKEAHQIFAMASNYVEFLPKTESEQMTARRSHAFLISFEQILASNGHPQLIPLLPPVRARLKKGKSDDRALEQALKRHDPGAPDDVKQQIKSALQNKKISCWVLEQVRFHRFRKNFSA